MGRVVRTGFLEEVAFQCVQTKQRLDLILNAIGSDGRGRRGSREPGEEDFAERNGDCLGQGSWEADSEIRRASTRTINWGALGTHTGGRAGEEEEWAGGAAP